MLKKIMISCITALSLMMSFLPQQIFAEEESLTKEVYVNVAQFKPVKGGQWSSTYPITNLVDGSRRTFVVPEGTYTDNENGTVSPTGQFWFTVDLLHRYNIDRIEFYDRYNAADEGGRRYFKILAANKEDFSDAVELGSIGAPDDTIFPDNGPFAIDLDGTKAYRYIKMQRNGGYYHGYSEIMVFAKQTVTEVSRNKPAKANDEAVSGGVTYSASMAVDGVNSGFSDAWVVTTNGYHYMQVDLETPQHIGYVEMEGRNGIDDPNTRMMIGTYGTNSDLDASVYTSVGRITNRDDVKELSILRNSTSEYVTHPFPKFDAEVPGSMYQTTVDDSEAFRYIVAKKLYQQPVALGAFRAYVVNPRVTAADINGNVISLEFSDAMNAGTIDSTSVKIVKKSDGTEVAFIPNIIDEYSAELVMEEEVFGDVLNVEFSENVADMRGVKMAKNTVSFETAPAVEVEYFSFIDETDTDGNIITTLENAEKAGAKIVFKNNMSAPSDLAKAVVIAALFDAENTLVGGGEIRGSFDPGMSTPLYTGLDLSGYESLEGYTLSVFIWNNFRDMNPWTEYKTLN